MSIPQTYTSTLESWITKKPELPKVIVVYGPTACGKTALSIELAKTLRTEILSADSRQVYREMDIGTGKVTATEMEGIVHHMIDVIEPTDIYSVAEYIRSAFPILKHISDTGNIPIICGGTGLYINGLIYDMQIPASGADWKYREELEHLRQTEGNQKLWDMLHEVDPVYAEKLIPENYRYVIRGLEVFHQTGRSKSESFDTKTLRVDPFFITPYDDSNRGTLYERINTRVDLMFSLGLIEEVERLRDKYGQEAPGLATIGYKEICQALHGQISLDEAREQIKQHSRNYAKRQITWNKQYQEISYPIL